MIFGIIKDGVRGAFVRIVRTIVYIIIALVVFYVIGLITSKKASALTIKDLLYDPGIQNTSQSFDFWNGGTNHWFDFNFESNWTNTTDYDLIGFRFTKFNMITYKANSSTVYSTPYPITYNGILWQSNAAAVLCFSSSEIDNIIFCPIQKNQSYSGFSLVANVVDNNIDYTIHVDLQLERNRNFWNYDSTDIIQFFDSSGGFNGVTQQQIITNQIITQQTEYITNNSTTQSETEATTALGSISSQFNDILNGWGGEWSTLTHIVLEPINVILQAFDSSSVCQPIVLNVPYMENKQIILPCMSGIYSQYFGTFIALFVTIFSGLYAYRTIMKVLQTIKEVLDAENDKIEVIDL